MSRLYGLNSPFNQLMLYSRNKEIQKSLYTSINKGLKDDENFKILLRDKYKKLQSQLPQKVVMDSRLDAQGGRYQKFDTQFKFSRKK